MKIAIIGYGKMGHAIERIARERGHEIVAIIDADNIIDFDTPQYRSADVAIEFTTPATAADNCIRSFSQGVPVVCGSTGWTSRLPEIQMMCDRGQGTLLWSSNFSLGVNIFFAVNRCLSTLMQGFPQYLPSMTEIHHIHKLDHPSGTAITLAQGIIATNGRVKEWAEAEEGAEAAEVAGENRIIMPIAHKREGEVPGTHIIKWDSPVDSITIEHCAKSREGFALGAVVAAEWLKGRKGFQTMDKMMNSLVADSALLDLLR